MYTGVECIRKYQDAKVHPVLIRIDKTVYDPPDPSDGKRVLVMRLWPRGVSKEKVDVWMKDLGTPKEVISKWKAGKITWRTFSNEYERSLKGKEAMLKELADESRKRTVTLLCTEKDATTCHRSLLKAAIEKQFKLKSEEGRDQLQE
jgi:uncharacterized protein YeaO (DUF488 family)